MAVFRAFYRGFGRMLFVSVLCFACGFLSARAEEYTIAYLNQHGDEISDLTPDRYTEEELPLAKENLPNSEAVSIATGCELADELWYWDDKMSEPVDKIESVSDRGTTLYGNLDCGENRTVTLNPGGKEGIGSEGTRTLYYYRNLGESGEFFYNEYNGSKSASGVASSIVLPTYDDESYTFLGYYADPDDMETQCINERGYITEYGIQQMAEGGEGETSWDAVYEVRGVVDVHTVNYNCGNHGSGTPVSQSSNAYSPVNLHLANVCVPDSGYEFFGWSCYTSDINTTTPNTTIEAAGESLYMSVDWTCTALWVDVCPNSGVRMSILDDYSGTQADLVNNGFSSYATVSASGMCSSTPGAYQYQSMVQEPSSGTGYCWCHITAFDGVSVSDYSPWVYIVGDGGTCNYNDCQAGCNRYTSVNAMGRISLTDACAYNLSYTCGVISGSVYPQSDTVFLNETVNLPQYADGCTYVSGANFLGWDCHVSGDSNTINNGYSLTMPANNVVCDALWDVPQYTLTYDCGVNGTAPAGVTQAGGSNVTLANGCNGALSSDYDFQGWYCVSGNSWGGQVYNGNDTYTLYDNTMCTAIWTESNPCDPGFVARQEILGVFDENTFEEQNWTDVSLYSSGWEVPSGSGQTVSLTGMCSNTPGMFGVAGNPTQSGTIADNTYCWCQVTSYGSTALSGYPWVYSGINSSGCDTSNCSARCIGETPSIFYGNPDAQELFLQSLFTKNICEYTLTYDCDNGNSAQSALNGGTYEGGNSIGLSNGGNCDAPTGQTFDYWDCDNGIGSPPNNIVDPTPYDNMTCTAHWANIPVPTYSLTYNCNNNGAGGTAPTDSNSPYYAGTTGISLAGDEGSCNPPSNNMGFSGWSCHKENDSSTVFNEGDSMPAYNVVCDAQWEQLYNVIYNCNNNGAGGSAPASQSYFVGDTVSLLTTMPQNTCTAPNMNFDGWDCHKENDNTVPFNGGSAMQAYNVVCDAQWVHVVQYHCGSGTQISSTNFSETTSNSSVILADIGSFCTVPSGYVFYKWSCVSNVGYTYGDFYDSGYNYVFTSPAVYCTAVYREVSCNSGETTVPFVLGQEMTLTDWENNSSVWGGYSNITLGNLWNPTSASYSGNSAAFSNSSSNWTVTMNGKCSNTWWMTGETGHPSDSTGDHCWCQAGSVVVNGSSTTLINYPWVYVTQTGGCTANSCADICAIAATNGYSYSTDMANFFLQSLYTQNTCTSVPTTYTVTYHGGSCNASASTFYDTVNAGANYTVENPNCASADSHSFIPTDNCYEFVGWSENNPAQVQNPTIDYNNCDNCTTQTGSCGTISNVSSNIDLYAICDVMAHNVIYHDCDNTHIYTDSNAVWIGQGSNYTPLSPSAAPLSSSDLEIDPLSSFQGWATSETAGDGKSWCGLESGYLYPELYGGNGKKTKYNYSVSADKLCHDIDLYAVCCPLNLNWILNDGQWPTDPNNNQTTLQNQTSCEYGATAGQAGSITPLRTPLKPGYTFNGWLVTGYNTP